MNLYAASPESLWSSPAFVRFMACSAAAHVAAIFFVMYGPIFRFRSDIPMPVPVTLFDMPADAVAEMTEPAPPEPAPEPPKPPPEPEVKPPEPKPEPEPPKQTVEEALVVPDIPPEKPRPPKKKPPPAPKPVDVADLMKSVRAEVDKNKPPPKKSGGAGTLDPEMAAYLVKVKGCLRQNWVGAQRFMRRRDLLAQFEVELGPGGKVASADLTRPSGEDIFDETAERAIFKCQPWPEPPGGQTTIPITFAPEEMQ